MRLGRNQDGVGGAAQRKIEDGLGRADEVGMVDDVRRAFGVRGDGNCNCNMCPYMALNTLEKLYVALRDLEPRIELSDEVMERARVPLERMLEMAGRTVGQGDVGKPILEERNGGVPPEEIDPAISGD